MPKKRSAPPVGLLLDRYDGPGFLALHATKVTITGDAARNGWSSSVACFADGTGAMELGIPPASAGAVLGPNPEQWFAAAFGACFHGVLNLLAAKHGASIPDASIQVEIAFGRDPVDGQYALTADVAVQLPGMDLKMAQELVRAAERICPYAKLMRQGIESSVRVVI